MIPQPNDNNRSRDESLRKAAILVASLDLPAADALLDGLQPEQVRCVRQMMIDMGEIDPKEQRRVIDEFSRVGPMMPGAQTPGIELDAQTLPPVDSGRPFEFLHETGEDKLVRALAGERPQTIALVLSHLPAERAGNVLTRLEPAQQADVIRRLIDLEETDREILREVEGALQSRLAEQVPMQRRRTAGMKAVDGILRAAGGTVGMTILDNLAEHDRPLAERFGCRRMDFDDLLRLDDATLGAVFQQAEPELAMAALIGAAPKLIDRILGRFPADDAQAVRHRLDHPGPIRLSDVESARQQIADLARRVVMQKQMQSSHETPLAVC
ncbi:MAG: hypothetical protein HQ567_31110 [Candidatus Nealsonbacteria bacterium]|nr:hypothetical protein [Candidatus Nealsonbacteria bacterium]